MTDAEKRRLLEFNEGVFQTALAARQNNISIGGAHADILQSMTDGELSEFIELKRLNQKAVAASKRGDNREAILCFQQACEKAPFDAISMMSIGVSYAQLGDSASAVRCLEKAQRLDPNNQRIENNLRSIKAHFGL